jgi:DNA primase
LLSTANIAIFGLDMRTLIEKYLGTPSGERGNDTFYFCPVCNWKNPRLAVDYSKSNFHCWKCNWGGKSLVGILFELKASKEDINQFYSITGEQRLFKKAETTLDKVEQELLNALRNNQESKDVNVNISIPQGYVSLKHKSGKRSILLNGAFAYLKKRGLSRFEINYYDIQYNQEQNKLLFPSYDVNGKLNFYVERTASEIYKRYDIPKAQKKSKIIFYESLIDFTQPVILTEGVFDVFKLGFNAIPLLGSVMYKKILSSLIENDTKEVIVALDPDAIQNMLKILKYLTKKGIVVYLLDYSKASNPDKDPADMTKSELRTLLLRENLLTFNPLQLINYEIRQIRQYPT